MFDATARTEPANAAPPTPTAEEMRNVSEALQRLTAVVAQFQPLGSQPATASNAALPSVEEVADVHGNEGGGDAAALRRPAEALSMEELVQQLREEVRRLSMAWGTLQYVRVQRMQRGHHTKSGAMISRGMYDVGVRTNLVMEADREADRNAEGLVVSSEHHSNDTRDPSGRDEAEAVIRRLPTTAVTLTGRADVVEAIDDDVAKAAVRRAAVTAIGQAIRRMANRVAVRDESGEPSEGVEVDGSTRADGAHVGDENGAVAVKSHRSGRRGKAALKTWSCRFSPRRLVSQFPPGRSAST
jgi:hypothetical protein